jgi:hypothetical protein
LCRIVSLAQIDFALINCVARYERGILASLVGTWNARYIPFTTNEGTVRIQYKCLVPIYVFPEMKLCSFLISKTELKCSVSQFLHSYICERFLYFQDRSVYFSAAKYVDRFWEYINRSQTHDCRNWVGTEAVQFLYREYT